MKPPFSSGDCEGLAGSGGALPPSRSLHVFCQLSPCVLAHRGIPGPAEEAARRQVSERHSHLPVLGPGRRPAASLPAAGGQLEGAVQEDPPPGPQALQPVPALPPAAALPPAQGEVSTLPLQPELSTSPERAPQPGRSGSGGPHVAFYILLFSDLLVSFSVTCCV